MRGQSEVIAALLMTAVVLVGFTIVWIYLYPRYLEWEQQASSTALESRLAASEWLVIGKASLGGGRLNLTLVNTGSVGLKVRAVYVNESLAWQGALSLAPGQQGDVTAPLPREGRVFWVKVCTARGNCWTFLEANWTALVAAPPPPSQPPQPPPSPYAKFEIADYTQTIAGPVSSKQLFTATVRNTGSSSGTVVVEVRDSSGNLVNSSQATVPAGGNATISFYVTLPSSRGTYTWTVNAVNTATGAVDDSKSVLVTAKDIYLQSRSALFYTPFESPPSGWSSIGGNWSIAPGYGVGGTSALRGIDDDAGPGGDSVYYWQSSVSSYANLYALVQVTNVNSNDRIYIGYGLLEGASSSSRLYEVSLYAWGQSVRLGIYLWTQLFWIRLSYIDVPYSGTTYVLFLSFSRSGTSNSISATLYDQSGNALGSTSATNSLFSVNYFGLIVDEGTGYFDNLVVSSTRDPRYVQVNGLNPGWTAELRDSSGNLVSSAAADSSGTATLSVIKLPVILNGTIVIKDQYGNVVIQKTFSDIVGGDTYTYG